MEFTKSAPVEPTYTITFTHSQLQKLVNEINTLDDDRHSDGLQGYSAIQELWEAINHAGIYVNG